MGYVGHWGTLNKQKGSDYFLKTADSFSNKDNIIFLCIGGIKGGKNIRKGNIIYTPFVSDDRTMAEYYSCLDVLIYCSLNENFPLTTLEAMSVGVPIVSFAVGGVAEQIEHKVNGFIAELGNLSELQDGINYILGLNK